MQSNYNQFLASNMNNPQQPQFLPPSGNIASMGANSLGMPNPFATAYGPSSCYQQCMNCQTSGYTQVKRTLNQRGCCIFILLLLAPPFCFFACCCERNFEVRHHCNNCNHLMGKYQP